VTRIGLVTCSRLPDLDPEDTPLLAALADRGAQADAVVWDDPDVAWSAYDLLVVRSAWDYAQRREEFLAWAEQVSGRTVLANPLPVIAWNTDKHYLRELEAAGVRIVPTQWLEPERHLSSRALHTRFPAHGEMVIKPAVSAGSLDTGRYTAIDPQSRGLAIAHARRLLAEGRTVMAQRYLSSVDTAGERAHVFVDGRYSHSVLKGAMLDGPDVAVDGMYKEERISAVEASAAEVEMAQDVIATATRLLLARDGGAADDGAPFLYARVDLVSDDDGRPVLMELELVEPSLFPSYADGALERLADAIVARAARAAG
jgi:hypothetical protein